MSDHFTMCKLCDDGGVRALYRTPVPVIDQALIGRITKAFQLEGKPKDSGSRIVVQDRSAVLEIFDASGSIWWTRNVRRRSEPSKSATFPSEREAIAKANAHLKALGLADTRAKPVSVEYTETMYEKDTEKEPVKATTDQHVNYHFTLDDLPVWGPGAKMQVTFGYDLAVTEVLKFWREPKKERTTIEFMPAKMAVEIFRNHEAFSDLSDRTAKVVVDDIAVGYYTLPPREIQACLIPVYRFKGSVSTQHLERYEFTKHVIAVEITADLLKLTGGGITGSPPVI
jgi:hypothetical protein